MLCSAIKYFEITNAAKTIINGFQLKLIVIASKVKAAFQDAKLNVFKHIQIRTKPLCSGSEKGKHKVVINNESLNGLLNKLLYKLVIDCLTAAIKIQTISFLI